MPNIPVVDPLKREARREIPARSQPATKCIEGDTDADKLKGTVVATTAPADGQALTYRNGEWTPETPAVQPAATPTGVTEHAIMGTEHSGDFEYIPGTGLNITIGPGRYQVGTVIYDKSTTAITLTDNSSNYIFCNLTGLVMKSTTGFTTSVIPLWRIVTMSGAVTTVQDYRTPFRTAILSAALVPISDAAGDFTATEVEGALAELQSDNEAHVAAADPHTGYVREADANWIDLTDGGASTLHSHAGGGTHTLLDGGSVHSDTITQTPTRGSIIYGNATPKWDELVIGTAGKLLRSDGTDAAWTEVFSEVHYGFAPDALPTATVATGAPQGRYHLTGDVAETGIEVVTSCRVAGTSITLIIEIGSTNDADTATWSTLKSVTLGSGVKGQIDAWGGAGTMTADRLLRLNVSAVSGVWSGVTCDLRAKRPLTV